MTNSTLSIWLGAARPKTLIASVAPVLCGTALAFREKGQIGYGLAFCALFSAIFIQIGTNLVNDAADFEKGADTAERLGPTRMTQSGLLPSRVVKAGAALCFFVALLLGIPLVAHCGLPIVIVGLLSIVCGYAYTTGPFPLAYHGLGEAFVILFFGVVAVAGTYYVQALEVSRLSLILGLQMGLLATALIAINNYRDIDTDRATNKRTVAVRLGPLLARWEITLCLLVPFVLQAAWLRSGAVLALIPLLLLPLAAKLLKKLWTGTTGRALNGLLGMAALVQIAFAVVISLALVFA